MTVQRCHPERGTFYATLTRPRQWENPHSIPIPRLDAPRPYDPLAMPPHSRTLTPHCIAPT